MSPAHAQVEVRETNLWAQPKRNTREARPPLKTVRNIKQTIQLSVNWIQWQIR